MTEKFSSIQRIREALAAKSVSVGGWMQIGNAEVAEIMGQGGFDWVAVDLEHGSIDVSQLPNLFRSLELGGRYPLCA